MKNILVYLLLTLLIVSCKEDYFDIESTEVVTEDQLTAESLNPMLNGMYEWLIKRNSLDLESELHTDYGLMSILFSTDLQNDDMVMVRPGMMWDDYSFTNRDITSAAVMKPWNYFYKLIRTANQIIGTIPADTASLSIDDKAVFGQAYALRGMAYHYLVRIYQHTYKGHEQDTAVPLVDEKTPPREMRNNPRASVTKVYELIEHDFERAYNFLKGWDRPAKNKIDQRVVAGFRARVYLEKEEWEDAAKYAREARSGFNLMSVDEYKAGFNDINNPEWIWGAIVTPESSIAKSKIITFTSHMSSTAYGYAAGGAWFKAIDQRLYEAIPSSDVRSEIFYPEATQINTTMGARPVPAYTNNKFKPLVPGVKGNDEDYVFMRAAEMYLIEAEAFARSGNQEAASVLFEFVSSRDPEYVKSSKTGDDLADEIYYQRRIELWGEGFSYFDHKRLKKSIIRSYEGSNHPEMARSNFPAESNLYLGLIPKAELENNDGISQEDNNKATD